MEYNLNKYEIGVDPELRMYRVEWFTLPHMVKSDGVEPDENGRKIVPLGTLVDKDGGVCKLEDSGITGTPVGITHDTVDVTNNNKEVAIYVKGHLKGKRLNFTGEEYTDNMGKAVEEALPDIRVYPRPAVE